MNIIYIDQPLSDIERAEILFRGDLIIYRGINAMQPLIEYSDALLKKSLNGLEPTTAQLFLEPEDFLEKTGEVQTLFRNGQYAKDLFFAVLEECGLDLNSNYYDHFPMRIVPFDNTHNGAHRAAIGHHRDTWGSNLAAQINWWAPLYELEEERTIAFYPYYWSHPIGNNTDTWRFDEYLEKRKLALAERRSAYPSAPSPTEAIDESGVVKVVVKPGDVLNFSSAHLHASVPNSTQKTRFSVEMRTINLYDLQSGREAPNVDNSGTEAMYQWFKRITDRQSLAEVAVDQIKNNI